MSDERFLELLNLYLDHEIGAEEVGELEAEVRRSAARRRTYEEYCKLQRGCVLLFESECAQAPKTAAAVVRLREARGGAARRSLVPGGVWVGGALAAAAAVAVLLVALPRNDGTRPPDAPLPSVSELAAGPSLRSLVDPARPDPARAGLTPAAMRSVLFAGDFRSAASDGALWRSASSRSGLEWLDQVSLPPLRAPRVEDLRFDVHPAVRPGDAPVYTGQRPWRTELEMTAFQFQR
jgi:hypothetical protein